jgi:Zn-dependent protease
VLSNYTLSGLISLAVAGVLGLTLHEAAHAWVAHRLGDDTAKQQGRLTLDPRAHLDPFGFLLILLVGFGWARPVPVSPWRLRYGPRIGNALVAGAGPLTNLLIAIVFAIPARLAFQNHAPPLVVNILLTVVSLNVILCVFNLIPLRPLDGGSVLLGVVGAQAAQVLAPLQTYGPYILMGLLLLSWVPGLNFNPLGTILTPVIRAVQRFVLGI